MMSTYAAYVLIVVMNLNVMTTVRHEYPDLKACDAAGAVFSADLDDKKIEYVAWCERKHSVDS